MINNQKDGLCEKCEICSKKSPIFKLLSQSEQQIINQNRYAVRYRAGEMIVKQGTSATHFISLVEGMAKVYLDGNNSHNLILAILKPWQVLGGPGIHTDNKNHFSVMALVDSLVCYIDKDNFKKVLFRNSKFSYAYIENLSNNSIYYLNKIMSLSNKQMYGRVAETLLCLSDVVYEDTSFTMQLSRQDLANLSSLSRDTINRILKKFEKEKILKLRGREIKIFSPKKLKAISING